MRPTIKFIYNLLATPGLGNPHTPNEEELLLAGAKPVSISNSDSITTELQDAITSGSIIRINEHFFDETHKIYCHVSELPNAEKAAKIIENSCKIRRDAVGEDACFLSNFFNAASNSVDNLLDGSALINLPIRHFHDNPLHKDIEKTMLENDIVSADITIPRSVAILAQADKEEEGKELYARYYLDGKHDYPAVEDEAARVGELLGFTSNDLAWFSGEKYQNPFINKLMFMTMDIRKEARKNYMLMEQEDKNAQLASVGQTPKI